MHTTSTQWFCSVSSFVVCGAMLLGCGEDPRAPALNTGTNGSGAAGQAGHSGTDQHGNGGSSAGDAGGSGGTSMNGGSHSGGSNTGAAGNSGTAGAANAGSAGAGAGASGMGGQASGGNAGTGATAGVGGMSGQGGAGANAGSGGSSGNAGSGAGTAGVGAGAGSGGTIGGGAGQGGSNFLCGNGIVDPGEECDPYDWGGPVCNNDCTTPHESDCADLVDNDGDGTVDCGDSDCALSPQCIPGSGLIGSPCTVATQCDATQSNPVCLNELTMGYPGGYCSQHCDPQNDDCPAGTACTTLYPTHGSSGFSACHVACFDSSMCSAHYGCWSPDGGSVCSPNCQNDSDCPGTQHCGVDEFGQHSGYCTAKEDCGDGLDNDHDEFIDCGDIYYDSVCDTPTCNTLIANACNSAEVLTIGLTNGTTIGGTKLLQSSPYGWCYPNETVGSEKIYSFTPSQSGTLLVEVTTPEFPDLVGYIRDKCDDGLSEILCIQQPMAGNYLSTSVTAGHTYTIVIDTPSYATPVDFTLNTQVIPPGCGNGVKSVTEQCDDGNNDSMDGCSAICTSECPPTVKPLLPGNNVGDTTNGTLAMHGLGPVDACTDSYPIGWGKEIVYSFTPATDSFITLTLTSASSHVLYVRGACAAGLPMIACSDDWNNAPIDTSFFAQGGEQILIFVDADYTGEEGPFTLKVQLN